MDNRPVSPDPSSSSSDSPTDETQLFGDQVAPLSPSATPTTGNASVILQSPGQAKRRLPTGTQSAHSRDSKTRKRDDGNSRRTAGGGGGNTAGSWTDGREGGGGKREELVDIELAERLRREFGDPFDETMLKSAA
ncbi:hypothetical protein BD410DRAFT_839930 [Rickenella mellea]|uniref:Uncharacterized protein n=1 Tax=Rickenella mellea TaxID=50990 RepID=A0A4Y7Q407_9AGAM|nr:hypothetical protein BD410DRAFT_839930 [Rickenella mellea]